MTQIKMAFSLIFALLITGCASSPTQFASPDVASGLYTLGEGETLKTQKPKPRTIGYQDNNDGSNVYEVIDFTGNPYADGDEIPDSHMIGVRAADPETGQEIVIPIQYVQKIKGSTGDGFYVEHTVSGVQSPLPVSVIKRDGSNSSIDQLLWHFSPEGKTVGFVFKTHLNGDPSRKLEDMTIGGNLVTELITKSYKYSTFSFFHGETFDTKLANYKIAREKRMEEYQKTREKAKRMTEGRERRYKEALDAPKSVGQMVCSTDSYLGNVEQVANGRVKVRIIGLMAMPSEWLIGDDNYDFNFDIDTRDENKIRWFDSNKVGACEIDVTRG